MINTKTFKIGELFDIHPTAAYKMRNAELFNDNGKNCVVTNSSVNNGVTGRSNQKCTEKGNIITFSDTTTADALFYQPFEFIGYSHIQGMYPLKYKDKWNEKNLLYIVALIKKNTAGRFDYATKFTRKILANMVLSLPVDKAGDPDFNYMSERIKEFETERIRALEAYLRSAKLDNYELTNADKLILKRNIVMKKYKVGDLIEIESTKKKINAYDAVFGAGHPYVIRSAENNGIRGLIKADESWLNDGNTITFGQDTGTIFYQPKAYFTGDKIKIMRLKGHNLSERIALYLISAMKCGFKNFAWGQSSFNVDILKNVIIELPTTTDNKPDFEFMSDFIRVHQKIAIANAVRIKENIKSEIV